MTDTSVAPSRITQFRDRLQSLIQPSQTHADDWVAPHHALWNSIRSAAHEGKQVRPRLLLDVHDALGGQHAGAAIDAACAVELLHLALVVHDDIIDNDLVRRGKPNVTGQFRDVALAQGAQPADAIAWGEASALLAGDLALSLAHSTMARLDLDTACRLRALDVFDEAVHISAAGEHADVWLSLRLEDAPHSRVLAMLEQKTAMYSFEAPIALAAIIAGQGHDVVESLRVVGRHAGVIYQLRDDVLGVFGDSAQLGKSTTSDLRSGKETMLVAFSRGHEVWQSVEHLLGNPHLTDAEATSIRNAMRDSGAVDRVASLIAEHRTCALEHIASLDMPPQVQHQLSALIVASDERIS